VDDLLWVRAGIVRDVAMSINRVGVTLWPGAESMGYELTSEAMSVTVADLGAHLAVVVLRLAGNDELKINVGYPATASDSSGSHGASVGRYANRIARSRFTLDGVDYELDANEGEHHLHGGSEGFASYAWSADAETDGDTGRVVLHHKSKAQDMGYPGKVHATAVYALTGNQLTIDYRAKVTEPTPVNLTNHTYWNLGSTGTLDGHTLTVAADAYVDVDAANIPVAGPPATVAGTRYDCRNGRELSDVIGDGGFDHCFVLDPTAAVHATLAHDSGRRIDLATNQIGLQVYTGAHLAADAQGVALETQCLPDTPNRPEFGDSTVRPDDKYLATTTLTFYDG